MQPCVLVTWNDNTCWVSVIVSMNFFEFSSVICLLVTYLYPLSSMSGLATIDNMVYGLLCLLSKYGNYVLKCF